MFKKVILYICLGIFISQLVGFTVFFSIEKAKIRKHLKVVLKEGVPKEKLHIFIFSEKELSKLVFTKPNEFKIKEEFYDIVRRKKTSNHCIELQCVSDKQETNLFQKLSFLVDYQVSKEKHSPLKLVFSIIENPYLHNNSESEIKINIRSFQAKKYFQYRFIPYQTDLKINTPPPQLFC